MTIGWAELLILLLVVGFVIALAFRTGYTRGRRQVGARPESEQSDHADNRP